MPTFTTPTHTEYFDVPGGDRLWSRVPYQRGNVVLIGGDSITQYPEAPIAEGSAVENALFAFFGSGVYDLDEAELSLAAAGYTAGITYETWPAWL